MVGDRSDRQVSEEFVEGVVTRGLRSAPNYHNSSDARQQQRDDSYGLIEIAKSAAAGDEPKSEAPAAAANPNTDESDATKTGQFAARQQRNTIRFNADSINSVGGKQEEVAAAGEEDDTEQDESSKSSAAKAPPRRKKPTVPHYGDEVRFRVATHRRTGVKRAVELTVTVSAKAKLEKEIDAKLATMTRELGVVDKLKAGGGFIKCCDRLEDVYFPLHEIRASSDEQGDAAAEDGDGAAAAAGAAAEGSETKSRKQSGKKPTLREGDEVSFFVYEEKEDESGRSRPRLTALRVQKMPKGSVSFEDLLRSNVEGVVSKSPKEPRNGPEVIGSITPNADSSAENKENAIANEGESQEEDGKESAAASEGGDAKTSVAAPGETTKKASKKAKDSSKKKAKIVAASVAFRLSDTHDMSYSPIVGDVVLFDEVLDKRSGKSKAVNVRVVQLNPKNRERGVITSLRDDFGFIKCADRPVDAYFRFSDVMAAQRDLRLGSEVAFDVNVDPTKPEHARASRVEILPKGTVQWEVTVEDGLVGEVVVVPSGRGGLGSASGGRGKGSLKVANGRVRFTSTAKKFWLDFLPEVKEKIDSKFVSTSSSDEQKAAATGADADKVDASGSSEAEKKRKEIKLLFPVSLSKSERFAIHQYCDELGIQHQSSGEGPSRRLELVASAKVPAKSASAIAELPALELEFKMEDLAEVRYSPQVGDRVKFNLMLSTRTKQFLCKSVVCVESVSGVAPTSAAASSSKKGDTNAAPQRGEGFIVAVRNEGFGFIQPANAIGSSFDENLFFHIKEVTTGETLESLKVGMEVEYTASFDEMKKKTRALAITVLPAGTIKKAEPQVLKGVVTRPSFLQQMKAKGIRFAKNNKQAMSTIGKIRAIVEGASAADAKRGDDDNDDDDAEDDDVEDEVVADNAEGSAEEASETDTKKKPKVKTPSKTSKTKRQKNPFYAYNIKDIVDQSVVLREGDEVEFTALPSAKGPRASKIRVVALHAKQGVVVKVQEDFSGVIRMDAVDGSDEAPVEIPFLARNVLRGDTLGEGDRVEFAVSMAQPSTTRKIGSAAAAAAKAEAEAENETAAAAASGDGTSVAVEENATEEKFVGQATSVLRLSAGSGGATSSDARARAPRTVNSSLLQAMREVGASATVASRMATGPDGTRGFKEGWRTAVVDANAGAVAANSSSPSEAALAVSAE